MRNCSTNSHQNKGETQFIDIFNIADDRLSQKNIVSSSKYDLLDAEANWRFSHNGNDWALGYNLGVIKNSYYFINDATTQSTVRTDYTNTLDGTEPSVGTSASTTEPVSAPAATTIIVKVIAGKHNYYASAVAKAEFATTGVTDLGVGKTVASQTYVTPSGIVSATPVAGVNVVVTVYTDGTREVTKKVFKVK